MILSWMDTEHSIFAYRKHSPGTPYGIEGSFIKTDRRSLLPISTYRSSRISLWPPPNTPAQARKAQQDHDDGDSDGDEDDEEEDNRRPFGA
jgi:hypothetical protein